MSQDSTQSHQWFLVIGYSKQEATIDKVLINKQSPAHCKTVRACCTATASGLTMRLGCLARILLTLDVLIEAATAVNDEIATHIHCLQEHELTPEDRNHIEQNLADGVERALQVIGMHQLHQSLKLDELSVGCVDDQKMTAK